MLSRNVFTVGDADLNHYKEKFSSFLLTATNLSGF